MRVVYRYWSWLVFVAVIVQVGLAGYGAFDVAGEVEDSVVDEDRFIDAFGAHAGLGYLVILFGLILFVISLVARHRIKESGILFGLFVLQLLLAWFGFESPFIGFFHPVNALVLFALSGWIALSEWRGRGGAPAAALPAEPS